VIGLTAGGFMDSGQLREMGHEMNLDFWFEFASTYSYPAAILLRMSKPL